MTPEQITARLGIDTWDTADREHGLRAVQVAGRVYYGITRDQGTPYIEHPVAVAAILRDVGLFLSTLHEGWSRCAAEAILLNLPCVTSGIAGLGDLGRLTGQPIAELPRLAEQLHTRARTPAVETAEARQRLATFDVPYFTDAWRDLLRTTQTASTSLPDPAACWPAAGA